MSKVLADFVQSPGTCSSLSLFPFLWGLPPSQLDPRPSAFSCFPCTPLLQRSQTRDGEHVASPVMSLLSWSCSLNYPGTQALWRCLPALEPQNNGFSTSAHCQGCTPFLHTMFALTRAGPRCPFVSHPARALGPTPMCSRHAECLAHQSALEMLAWETDWVSVTRPCAGAHFLPFPLNTELCGPVWLLFFQVGSSVSQCTWSW